LVNTVMGCDELMIFSGIELLFNSSKINGITHFYYKGNYGKYCINLDSVPKLVGDFWKLVA